jgi:hypothetical protein
MFGLFKSKQPAPGRGLYLINVKVGRGSNGRMPKSLAGAYVSAYVTADDDESATRLALTRLTAQGFRFLDTQGPITRIDLRHWPTHVAQSWPEFMNELPKQNEIAEGLNSDMVFFGPFVGYEH